MSKTTPDLTQIKKGILQEELLAGLSSEQHDKLAHLIELVVSGQDRLNLTAIRDPLAMIRYHLADSIALLPAMAARVKISPSPVAVDIGTGGGFPLLPMAIAMPEYRWIGIESVQKKAEFVNSTARKLHLDNVEVRAERAEDAGRGELRESVDIVTARAVGPVAALLEVGVPFLKNEGCIYLFKTESARAEWENCLSVLTRLGAQPLGEWSYQLAGDSQQRVLFMAQKVAETPATFPRRAGVPFKKPLAP